MIVQLSVLDRLMDRPRRGIAREPDGAGVSLTRKEAISRVKENLLLDLEALLNTRQNAFPPPRSLGHVHRSLALYGLPDFSTERNPEKIASHIKSAIEHFEPRLKVIVRPVSGKDAGVTSSMRFRISGAIRLRPAPEPVVYETIIDIGNGQCTIEGTGA